MIDYRIACSCGAEFELDRVFAHLRDDHGLTFETYEVEASEPAVRPLRSYEQELDIMDAKIERVRNPLVRIKLRHENRVLRREVKTHRDAEIERFMRRHS